MRIKNLNWVFAVLSFGSVPVAWGGITACAPMQTLGVTVVGTGQGCSYLNSNFDNFNVGAAAGSWSTSFPVTTGSNGGSTESTNIDFTQTGTTTTTLDFGTLQQSSGSGHCPADSWCMPEGANSTSSQTIGYEVVASGGFDSLGLMDGTLPNGYLSNGDVITTEEQFCLGASTFNCTTTSSNYGYLQVQETSNGSGGYTSVFTACLPGSGGCSISAATGSEIGIGRQTQIAIQDTVSISTLNSGGKPVFIDSFYNDFETAPEPSTFVLLGIALAGFGLLRLRQKRA
jgi:hypothetical protein